MRPKIKDDAQRVSLTLSAPKREILMRLARSRGVSRTQVVEDLLEAATERSGLYLSEGKSDPHPHNGGGASNTIEPFDGGSERRPTRYQSAREAARSLK